MPVGFGTAGLYSLPTRRERQAMLVKAYDMGIRHFDVAPTYGLGRAEPELRTLLAQHRAELTVTSKVGLRLTGFATTLGYVQGVPRAALRRLPKGASALRQAAASPQSGRLGRLFYRSTPADLRAAEASIHRSLKRLGTSYIDYLLVHDPAGPSEHSLTPLLHLLCDLQDRSVIRCWGATGPIESLFRSALNDTGLSLSLHQFADDALTPLLPSETSPALRRITFGALRAVLPLLTRYVGSAPGAARRWSDLLASDLLAPGQLSQLLLAEAIVRNDGQAVLVSTTRQDRLRSAIIAANDFRSGVASQRSRLLRSLVAEARRSEQQVRHS